MSKYCAIGILCCAVLASQASATSAPQLAIPAKLRGHWATHVDICKKPDDSGHLYISSGAIRFGKQSTRAYSIREAGKDRFDMDLVGSDGVKQWTKKAQFALFGKGQSLRITVIHLNGKPISRPVVTRYQRCSV